MFDGVQRQSGCLINHCRSSAWSCNLNLLNCSKKAHIRSCNKVWWQKLQEIREGCEVLHKMPKASRVWWFVVRRRCCVSDESNKCWSHMCIWSCIFPRVFVRLIVVQDPTSRIVTAAISLEKDSSGRGISWSSRIAATSHQNARVFSVLNLRLS